MARPQRGCCDVIREHAATDRTAQRLTEQLRACEAAALAFCRLLERWNRGEAIPATAGARGGMYLCRANSRHGRCARASTAPCGGPRGDRDRRPGRAALALPARARAG